MADLINREDLLAEYDRVHIGEPGKARRLIANATAVDAVVLPCKMGDLVWGIRRNFNNGHLAKRGVVSQMFFGEDMRLCISVKNVCRGEWGKNVFATREEAEAMIAKEKQRC